MIIVFYDLRSCSWPLLWAHVTVGWKIRISECGVPECEKHGVFWHVQFSVFLKNTKLASTNSCTYFVDWYIIFLLSYLSACSACLLFLKKTLKYKKYKTRVRTGKMLPVVLTVGTEAESRGPCSQDWLRATFFKYGPSVYLVYNLFMFPFLLSVFRVFLPCFNYVRTLKLRTCVPIRMLHFREFRI